MNKQQQLSGTESALFQIKNTRPLWKRLKEAGVQIERHESDLYFPETPESMEILKAYRVDAGYPFKFYRFIDSIDKANWIDVPFAATEMK